MRNSMPFLNVLMHFFWGVRKSVRWVAIFSLASLLLSYSSATAGFGIGVHGGLDLITIDGQQDVTFNIIDSSLVGLSREEISNPYHFGVHVFVDDIPAPFIHELDVSLDFSSVKYKFDFSNPSYSLTESQLQPEEVKFSRVGVTISVRHYLITFPPGVDMVRLYVGAGLGMQLISPIVGRDLVYDNVFESTNSVNLEDQDVLKKSSHAAFVGLAGVRFQPESLPISLRLEGRYAAMGEWDYEQPEKFFSMTVGVSYSF